ncbi:hypothetical protein FHT70_003671 [Rhizobium sp. BK049]|nr:hypothetical protein [Rhizobium sp. BK049]
MNVKPFAEFIAERTYLLVDERQNAKVRIFSALCCGSLGAGDPIVAPTETPAISELHAGNFPRERQKPEQVRRAVVATIV